MDALRMSLAQLGVGFIYACMITAWLYVAYDILARRRKTVTSPNEARIQSAGHWQYADAYFEKITEFRNDFAS